MTENKIQVSSIQRQINYQISLIKELSDQKANIDSDLALAKELLNSLQSRLTQPQNEIIINQSNPAQEEKVNHPINPIKRSKRPNTKPALVDDNVINALSIHKEGMTNAEIERFLIREKDLLVSKNGIQAALNRLIDRKVVKLINPSDKRNFRFALI